MAKSRTLNLNIQASYFKKVSLKHCIMKARNSLKKIGRNGDSDIKKGGIAGLREKNNREDGIWEPYCDPLSKHHASKT